MSTTVTEQPQATSPVADTPRMAAFISAPSAVDTTVIREMLERHGMASFTADEVALPGCAWSELIRECLARADLVIAVLDGGKGSNGLYELGFAQALEKRTLILVNGDDLLPLAASTGAPYLRTTPENSQAIDFGLSQILKLPQQGTRTWDEEPEQTRPLGPIADELLGRLRADLGSDPGSMLEQIVLEALERSGVSVVSKAAGPADRSGIGVWSDDLEPWVANPLLVEVQLQLPQADQLRTLENRLLRQTGARRPWALLIYKDADDPSEGDRELRGSQVLCLSAEHFLEALRTTSLGDLIRRLRKARMPGRG